MKVLFLDIDGVLNGWPSQRTQEIMRACSEAVHNRVIFPDALDRLVRVVRATGCRIVLSSTWRQADWRDRPGGHEWCVRYLLALHGIEVLARTGAHQSGPHARGQEIADWLDAFPGIDGFAIVDDCPEMLPEQQPYLVSTACAIGMLDGHADKLIEILGATERVQGAGEEG